MGLLDGVKGRAPQVGTKGVEGPAKTAAPAAAAVTAEAPSEKGNGFDVLRKKLMSVSGRYKVGAAPTQPRPDLLAEISGKRGFSAAGIISTALPLAGAGVSKVLEKTVELGKSTRFGKDSAAGKPSKAEWADPALLLGKLTQFPAGRDSAQSKGNCGPSNMLGIAFMNGGSNGAASMLEKVAQKEFNALTPAERTELTALSQKVKNQTASFKELNKAQELLYRSVNTGGFAQDLADKAMPKLGRADKQKLTAALEEGSDAKVNALLQKALGPDTPVVTNGRYTVSAGMHATDAGGLSDGELENLGDAGVTGVVSQRRFDDDVSMQSVAAGLEPGQAVILRLGSSAEDPNPDHFVTVGRKPDGSFYVYNPDPGKGDHTMVAGKTIDADFIKHLARYNDRIVLDKNNTVPPGLDVSWSSD